MKRSLFISALLGTAFALVLSLSLAASDAVFQSRLMPWVVPLLDVQDAGFWASSSLFPCRQEGSDKGCEGYKTLPAFFGANSLAYSICLFPAVHLMRKKKPGISSH